MSTLQIVDEQDQRERYGDLWVTVGTRKNEELGVREPCVWVHNEGVGAIVDFTTEEFREFHSEVGRVLHRLEGGDDG